MKILLTNDDGIDAPGIQAAKKRLNEKHDVYLIAPRDEMSASGHSITVRDPLRVERRGKNESCNEWAVEGTPADCVKLGIDQLLAFKPDLVVSGINNGANLGNDIFYSGTVAAAMEGMIMGVPSLAVSLNSFNTDDYSYASEFTLQFCQQLWEEKLLQELWLLNVNIPAIPPEEIKGVSYTRMGRTDYSDIFHQRRDPRDRTYYWLAGNLVDRGRKEDTDISLVKKGYITITPLQIDLTDYRLMERMKEKKVGLPGS